MGVYIPGLEMPQKCVDMTFDEKKMEWKGAACPFMVKMSEFFYCTVQKQAIKSPYNQKCTAKLCEVKTPHGRLIDADKFEYAADLEEEPTIIEQEK